MRIYLHARWYGWAGAAAVLSAKRFNCCHWTRPTPSSHHHVLIDTLHHEYVVYVARDRLATAVAVEELRQPGHILHWSANAAHLLM
jgi:hypothetical protein